MRELKLTDFQINTCVWLTELCHALGRPATLDDMLEAAWNRLAELGFDWVWFPSLWQRGETLMKALYRPHQVESRYAESALEGWGRVTGKMRKSFQG